MGRDSIRFAILLNTTSRSVTVTMLLMTISVFSTLRYGYWRVIQTWEGITSAGHIHRWDTVFRPAAAGRRILRILHTDSGIFPDSTAFEETSAAT